MQKLSTKIRLGKTNIQAAPVICGTSTLGNLYKAVSRENKQQLIADWFDCIEKPVVIDSAGKYGAGLALEEIGNGLSHLGISPNEALISNKLGWIRTPLTTPEPTFEPGAWVGLEHDAVQKISYDGMLECYEQGISLLGGSYKTQILSVHDPDEYIAAAGSDESLQSKHKEDILGAYEALFSLKSNGDAEAIGVGSKDWKVIQWVTDNTDLDWVMIATEFTIKEHPTELIEYLDELKKRNISVINSAVFHGGFLTGGEFYNYRKLSRENEDDLQLFQWRDEFHRICGKYGVDPAHAGVVFGMSHPAIAFLALSTSRVGVISKNVEMVVKEIGDEFWKEMKAAGLIEVEYGYIG